MTERIHYAGAILLLPDGRWVLQRRRLSASVGADDLGFWGGKVEPSDDSPNAACAREIAEETSLHPKPNDLESVGEFNIDPPIARRDALTMHVFRLAVPDIGFVVVDGVAEVHSVADLRKRDDLLPTVRYVLDNILEK